jgi:hypothetical protein
MDKYCKDCIHYSKHTAYGLDQCERPRISLITGELKPEANWCGNERDVKPKEYQHRFCCEDGKFWKAKENT